MCAAAAMRYKDHLSPPVSPSSQHSPSRGYASRNKPTHFVGKKHLNEDELKDGSQGPFAFEWNPQGERRNRAKAVFALCLVQTLFALGTVYVKWALKSTRVNAIILLLYREIFAAAILILLSVRHGAPRSRDFSRFLLAGFCMFLNQALFIVGVDLSGAVVASCIQPSQPVVTFAIAVLVGQEKLDLKRCLGLSFAVMGAVWVVTGDMLATGKSAAEVGKNSMLGDLCLIANCLAMGWCYVLVKQLNKVYSSIVVIAWIYGYAAAFLIFTAIFFIPVNAKEWDLPGPAVPVLLYLVCIASVLGYILISWSNRHLDSSQVSSFTCLQPMVGAAGAVLILKETPTAGEVVGGAMIIVGLLLTVFEKKSKTRYNVI